MEGKVLACCIADKKGIPKREVPEITLVENFGVLGDIHAGGERQVSLLAKESVEKSGLQVPPGAFGENIFIEGVNLSEIQIGDKVIIEDTLLEVTHKGKKCHTKCAIFYKTGKCIMPVEGVFAKVLKGGKIKKGAVVKIEK